MKIQFSTSHEFIAKAKKEGKIESLNSQEDIQAMEKMNEHLDQARREFKVKELRSIEAASKAILTA